MNKTLRLLVVLAGTCFVFQVAAEEYLGSDFCFDCHAKQYNDWKASGHPYKLITSEEAAVRPIPLPEGYSWDDISYVIGGYRWKSRYIDNNGYIITNFIDDYGEGAVVPGQNQYNYLTGKWSDYHAGEVNKPYNCGACHTTGWVADEDPDTDNDLFDNQDRLPGMHGTFAEGGIGCEGCHGPGFTKNVDDSAELCGQCHIRGEPDTIPASSGFVRHHEQYNTQQASPHKILECTTCHDPHKTSQFSIKLQCEDCHSNETEAYAGTPMEVNGVSCIDCHMPLASKSAQALGPHQGDLKTHLFRINTDAGANMFTEDGKFVNLDSDGQGAVTLDFACQQCHYDKSMDWLSLKATNIHRPELQAIAINAGLNDAWFSPVTSGQGFFITVYPDKGEMFISWFTFDTERPPASVMANLGDAGHRWLTAQGAYDGNQAVLDVTLTEGGEFGLNTPVNRSNAGTLIVHFSNCENGTIEYDIPSISRQGTINIQRVASDNVGLCKAL